MGSVWSLSRVCVFVCVAWTKINVFPSCIWAIKMSNAKFCQQINGWVSWLFNLLFTYWLLVTNYSVKKSLCFYPSFGLKKHVAGLSPKINKFQNFHFVNLSTGTTYWSKLITGKSPFFFHSTLKPKSYITFTYMK